jgi:hypothetical protein
MLAYFTTRQTFYSPDISLQQNLDMTATGYRSRGPGFDSRRFQIFWEAVGLERGPLSLVSTREYNW